MKIKLEKPQEVVKIVPRIEKTNSKIIGGYLMYSQMNLQQKTEVKYIRKPLAR